MIWYFKSNQKQNNRNRKEIKERERRKLPGATYLAQLHLAGPAHLLPLVLFLLCQEDEQRRGVARAREASATSCFPLATSCFLSSPWTPSAMPRTVPGLALSPFLLPPFSGSLSPPPSGAPSPPTPFAAATTTPSPPRRAPELRSAALDLLDVSRDQKGPE